MTLKKKLGTIFFCYVFLYWSILEFVGISVCHAQLDFPSFSLVGYNRVFPLSLPLTFPTRELLPLARAFKGIVRSLSLVTCRQRLVLSSPSLQDFGLISSCSLK